MALNSEQIHLCILLDSVTYAILNYLENKGEGIDFGLVKMNTGIKKQAKDSAGVSRDETILCTREKKIHSEELT